MTPDEPAHRRDEYLTHRLQAFSDIVIGFSLAQLALTLVVPSRASELWAHRTWLIAYLWTFAVVGGIWSGHTRLFRQVFVPTRINVILNFIMLASLGLSVYFVQLYMRLIVHVSDVLILGRSYFSALAIMMLCFGAMYTVSLMHRPELLHASDVQKAAKTRARNISVGTGTLLGVVASFLVPKEYGMLAILGGLIGGAIIARALVMSFARSRRYQQQSA